MHNPKAFVRGCDFVPSVPQDRNCRQPFCSAAKNSRLLLDSMEGHGDVLQDLGGGEAGPPTRVVLQAPVGLTQVLQLSTSCQPSHSRWTKVC